MDWLQTHWMARAGTAALGFLVDQFLEMLTSLAPRSDQSEPALMGLIELATTRFTPPST